MLLENRKKQLELSLLKQPRHEIGPARSARATPGPSAQQPMARPPNRPGAAPLLGHIWPMRRPPFSAVRRRRSGSSGRALFSRNQNPATMRRPQTLGSFPLSVFSLHKTAAAMEPGKEATAPPPAPSPARVLPCVGARRRRAAWRWCPFGANAWRSNPSPRAAAPICAGKPVFC